MFGVSYNTGEKYIYNVKDVKKIVSMRRNIPIISEMSKTQQIFISNCIVPRDL